METKPRIGMYAAFGFHVPFEERVRHIAEAGFHDTSLWWEHKNERVRELKHLAPAMVREAGIEIESVHVPYFNCNDLWCEVGETREAALALHCEWIDDCSRHEVPIMVMHVTLGKEPPEVNDVGLESYKALVQHAESQGVCIAIENTRVNDHIDTLLGAIDSPSLGFCYDISHDVLYSETPGQLLRVHGSRLVSTHFADTDGILDRHWLPGAGTIDYAQMLQFFPSDTYRGTIMLEVSSGRKQTDIKEFIRDAHESIHEELIETIYPNGRT